MTEIFRAEPVKEKISKDQEMMEFFNCSSEQIARSPKDIKEGTKAYVGKLEPGVFDLIQKYNIEHVYTEFPEGRLVQRDLEIGGLSCDDLAYTVGKIIGRETSIGDTGNYLLDQMLREDSTGYNRRHPIYFKKEKESLKLIDVTVSDLFGDDHSHRLNEIYERAKELGLELSPGAVGPYLCMQLNGQPIDERQKDKRLVLNVAMYPIYVSGGRDIFTIFHSLKTKSTKSNVIVNSVGLSSTCADADPNFPYDPRRGDAFFADKNKFIFQLPRLETKNDREES